MDNLLLALLLLSLAGLTVGLIRPARVRMASRKSATRVFGGAAIVFFILFGLTSSTPQPATTTETAVAPSTPVTATTSAPVASSSAQSATLTPAQQQLSDDAGYVSSFDNLILPDLSTAGTDLANFGKDGMNFDYSSAISDLKQAQTQLQATQADLQTADKAYMPLSPDVARIRTLAYAATAAGLKSADTALSDLENGNASGAANDAYPSLETMMTDTINAKGLAAGWAAKHPGALTGQ